MTILTTIALTLVMLSTPVGADDPPAPPAPTPPVDPTTPSTPATPVDPATPSAPAAPTPPVDPATPSAPAAPATPVPPSAPASPPVPATPPRPDFSAIQKHLVVVKDGVENDAGQSPGFSISDQGHIVTSGGELQDGQSYVVVTAGGQVFSATRLKADETTGLWILHLSEPGHGLTGLPFAGTALQAAAPLHAVNFNPSGSERFTSVPGTVTQLMTTEQGQMIQHNALFSPASAGSPLLNRCFQAVGVNLLEEEGRLFSRPVDPTQKGSAQSLASASLGSLLTSTGLSLPVAGSECLSLEAETQQEREQARQAQEAERQREQEAADQRVKEAEAEAQRQLEEAQRKEEALQREKEAAEERARRIEAEKRRTEAEAQRQLEQQEQDKQAALQRQQDEARRKEAALQREKDEAEERQRHLLLIAAVVGGLALLGGVLLMRRKQKRLRATEQEKQNLSGALNQAQSELSQAEEQARLRGTAPDVFLEGQTPPIALKIPGAALVEQAGAVVGRSPSASTFVINHEQISRQHFRLSLTADQIMIEDLGSTNGTRVDGVPLEPGQQMPVSDGSRLGLGDLELTLHIGG